MRQFDAAILANRPVADSWREIVLAWEPSAGRPEPGQFFTIRVSPRYDPLLRRPLAFAGRSPDGSSVSAVYQLRGTATRLLAGLGPGAAVDLLGPLGRAFPPPSPAERPVLAAGGIGLGPILFLARALSASRSPGAGRALAEGRVPDAAAGDAPILVLGFRRASDLPDLELPPGAVICTDDGSAGFRGTPVEWISRNAPAEGVRLYGCGPGPMLAALAALARARGWTSSLSAEQWMACGVGACMGCALRRADGAGYLRACSDGPVFDSPAPGGAEVDWGAACP